LKTLYEDRECKYNQLENAREIDNIDIPENEDGFDFFHGLGIVGYKLAFKMWLRKFPRPILIAAMKDRQVIGWAFVEEWGDSENEQPVHVLRAIEVLPDFKGKGIGRTLVVLSVKMVPGYLITKPMTNEAERFFKKIGFMRVEEFKKPPVDLSKNPKYMIFPIYKKDILISSLNQTSGSRRT
jgi:GNAT superfamily N-acetyltransferase